MNEKRIVVDEEDEKFKIENKKNTSEILGEQEKSSRIW